MRIFPKKTKMRNEVFKNYTILELVIMAIIFGAVLLLISNSQWIIAVLVALIGIILFIPYDDAVFYQVILDVVKFVCTKKNESSAEAYFDVKEITEDGYLKLSNGNLAFVVEIGQKDFFMQTAQERDFDIQAFGRVLALAKKISLVKTEKYINYDTYVKKVFDKLNSCPQDEEIKRNILISQIGVYDALNHIEGRAIPAFFLCVNVKNKSEAEELSKSIVSELGYLGLEPKLQDRRGAAVFLRSLSDRCFDERELLTVPDDELLSWAKFAPGIKFAVRHYTEAGIEASTFAVSEYPINAADGWGANIFNLPDTKVVMTMNAVERGIAAKRIDKTMLSLSVKEQSTEKATELSASETHQQTLANLIDALNNGSETLFDTSILVTAYNYSGDKNYVKNARRAVQADGFRTSGLLFLQKTALKHAMLGEQKGFRTYERGINSGSLGAVFPFVNTTVNDEDGINYGYLVNTGTPFIFDIFKRGGAFQNSNAFIIGKSGSGKSYFIKQLCSLQWAEGAQIYLLDPEAEYLRLTSNLGGTVIDVGNASEGRINPFHIYQILDDDGKPASAKQTFTSHLKTLESFFKLVLETTDSDILELMNILTVQAYNAKGIFEDTDVSRLSAENFPTFSDVAKQLNLMLARETDEYILQRLKSLELSLRKFTCGRYSDIWNGYSTLSSSAQITDFNFQSLFASHNNVVANAQMLLIFRFIEQQIINVRNAVQAGENTRVFVIADEAHLFIDAKFPIALDFFYQMSKRIRKYNGSFIPATQNISDWNANEELRSKTSAIIKNSQYSFIFKLSAPDMQDLLALYSVGGNGFNENEQNAILRAETGQTFFMSDSVRARVKIEVNDVIRDLFV